MFKGCSSVTTAFIACLAIADAFFLPVFVSKKQDVQQPSSINNVGWGRSPLSGQQQGHSNYRDYYMGPVSPMQMPMASASMQQFSYDPSSVIMSPYRQQMQYMEPQFHNVKLVPCMCPLTQDLIDQHTQGMMQPSKPSPTDATKLTPVSSNNNNSK